MTCFSRYLKKHGFEALSPKAVLFDMDGVLYDSMPNHAVAWQESMAKFGIRMTAADAYATEGARGIDTIRQMVKAQQGRDIGEQEAQAMYDEKSRRFHLMPEAPMMPGARELMAQIQKMGLVVCVVTGSGQRPLIERLKRDYGDFLDEKHIVTAYDVTRGKPHPEPYLKGLEKCGVLHPWEAVVVENAPLGVEAAVAARIFTICVNTGHLPVKLFEERHADLILDSMIQLNERWPLLNFCNKAISQEERWMSHYYQVLHFMEQKCRRPSKYESAERELINWIKYNRKLIAKDKLPANRVELFRQLEAKGEELKRLNQFAYKHTLHS